MESFDDVFSKVCDYCKDKISSIGYNLWIQVIKPVSFDGDVAVLYVKSIFQKKIITEKYMDLLLKAFEHVVGFSVKIEVKCDDEIESPETEENEEDDPLKIRSFDIPANTDNITIPGEYEYTFGTFIVGPSNKFAHAASLAVAANPSGAYNPLFIYGESGLGKTHLLYAICNEISNNFKDKKIIYVKGEEFTNELIDAIGKESTKQFHDKYRCADILLVDDIQFIGGKESTQEEFFHTFNELYQAGKQIVLTSDRPPKEIKTLEDRLRTRFEWGLLADVQAPDFETRIAIIRRKAELLDIAIPDDVSEYIANRLKNNIRQLEGVVKKLKAYKLLAGTPPSVAIAQSAIKDILNDNQPTSVSIDRVISEVSQTYGVSPADIKSSKRSANISIARQIAIYIVREVLCVPMSNIGEEFGGRDHSTIVYALQQVENKMKKDIKYKETVEDIIKNIRNG
ncbi:MAG: chromosomal replication initiator protein DnaA [Oscillospiraceae bacterium]|nr:chromosomal replication initiator protein DnaA [Oscillospiraceae bacterium]